MDLVHNLGLFIADFKHIARVQDKDVLLWNSQILGKSRVGLPVAVLAMDRDRILRLYQGIDQFQFFLAGMSRYMGILEDDICSLG